MNYNKLKNELSTKGISVELIADELDRTSQAVYAMFKKETMTVKQLESICKIINAHPCAYFDEQFSENNTSLELVNALKDKVDLQKDIIKLLREQLEDCKMRFGIDAKPGST